MNFGQPSSIGTASRVEVSDFPNGEGYVVGEGWRDELSHAAGMGESFASGCGTAAGVEPLGLEPASRQGQSQSQLLVGEALVPTLTTGFIRRGRSDIEKVVLAGVHQNPGGCAKRQSTLQQV